MSLPVWLWGLCLLSCGFAVLAARTDRFVWAFFSALLAVGSAFAALMLNAPWSEALPLLLLPLAACFLFRRREADG